MLRGRLLPVLAVSVLLLLVSVAAIAGPEDVSAAGVASLDGRRLGVRDGRLVDAMGREITLRGVNARVRGIFDVSFDDGRLPLQEVPELGASDVDRMRALGFNLLRLPIAWSALEPERGVYDPAYLDRIARVVRLCGSRGILVLLDFHQDGFSKEIGQDGAPRWVLDRLLGRSGYPALGGPLRHLGLRQFAPWTLLAFRRFFDDRDGVQSDFAAAAVRLARRFRGSPHVLGYELMNEPLAFLSSSPGGDPLLAFYVRVGRAIRSVDPDHFVVFEPDVVRNWRNGAPLSREHFPIPRALYAPHIYTGVLDGGRYRGDPRPLARSMEHAAREAAAWGVPLLIGEYGIAPHHALAKEWVREELDLQDQLRAGSAFWLWEETDSGRWGLFEVASTGEEQERRGLVDALSRVYARAVPGRVTEHDFDAILDTLTLRYRGPGRGDVVLFVPHRRYPQGFLVSCDGKRIHPAWDRVTGTVSFPCGGGAREHHVTLSPEPRRLRPEGAPVQEAAAS